MDSIMQKDRECYFCLRQRGLERHHVLAGAANRKLSEKYGLWVWLCHDCHTGDDGAQYDSARNRFLKEKAQEAFEAIHGHEKWMEVFRKNYL